MKMSLIFLSALSALVPVALLAQEPVPAATPDAAPTAVKRTRTFDQFDLPGGVQVKPAQGQTDGPITVELVNADTYAGLLKLVDYFARVETEYRATDGQAFDPVSPDQPERALSRKLNAIYRVTEIYGKGLLGQAPLASASNQALLAEVQMIIREALAVAAVRGDWTHNTAKLAELADKYDAASSDKRVLLTAMLGQLNRRMTRLKGQIAVKQ
ncbi:MAG: hypothetical protein ACK4S4_11720 [Pyrinomonadaceae bacterium]